MKHLHSAKSLEEYSDRELLLIVLANQVNLFRQTQYLMAQVKNGEIDALGHFSNTFHDMIGDVDDILMQSEEYLNQEDTDKGFIRF